MPHSQYLRLFASAHHSWASNHAPSQPPTLLATPFPQGGAAGLGRGGEMWGHSLELVWAVRRADEAASAQSSSARARNSGRGGACACPCLRTGTESRRTDSQGFNEGQRLYVCPADSFSGQPGAVQPVNRLRRTMTCPSAAARAAPATEPTATAAASLAARGAAATESTVGAATASAGHSLPPRARLPSPVPAPEEQRSAAEGETPLQGEEAQGLYSKFVQHCMLRMGQRMPLTPYPIKDEWRLLRGQDGSSGTSAVCRSTAASAPKIRFVRSADISAGPNLQVLNLVAFPRPTFDLPFFCADLVTFPRGHLIVIDMNPLYQTEAYLDKYFRTSRMTDICNKYSQTSLPWGGEFTAESLQFFSQALLWSRLPLDQDVTEGPVFQAFCEYLEVWLDMVDECSEADDPLERAAICEAQHRYMCWRAEKDPGRPVLTRLFGSERCEDFIHNFLFDGLYTLGDKGFLDYFPQYRLPDGSVCKKRSMVGKSYLSRPWDQWGRLLPEGQSGGATVGMKL